MEPVNRSFSSFSSPIMEPVNSSTSTDSSSLMEPVNSPTSSGSSPPLESHTSVRFSSDLTSTLTFEEDEDELTDDFSQVDVGLFLAERKEISYIASLKSLEETVSREEKRLIELETREHAPSFNGITAFELLQNFSKMLIELNRIRLKWWASEISSLDRNIHSLIKRLEAVWDRTFRKDPQCLQELVLSRFLVLKRSLTLLERDVHFMRVDGSSNDDQTLVNTVEWIEIKQSELLGFLAMGSIIIQKCESDTVRCEATLIKMQLSEYETLLKSICNDIIWRLKLLRCEKS